MFDLKKRLENIDQVKTLLYLYRRGLKYAYSSDLHQHTFIIGLTNYENVQKIIESINEGKEVLIDKIQEHQDGDILYIIFNVIQTDGKSLTFYMLDQKDLEGFLPRFRNYEVLKDTNKMMKEYSKKDNTYKFWPIPDEIEFYDTSKEYLFSLLDAALAYDEGDEVKANLELNDLVDTMIDLFNVYISIKYDNKVYVDAKASNLKIYLDNDYYDEFEQLVKLDRGNDFWTGLFKLARLYRQIGLEVANYKKYTYPKEEDVRILNYLRNLYNKEN